MGYSLTVTGDSVSQLHSNLCSIANEIYAGQNGAKKTVGGHELRSGVLAGEAKSKDNFVLDKKTQKKHNEIAEQLQLFDTDVKTPLPLPKTKTYSLTDVKNAALEILNARKEHGNDGVSVIQKLLGDLGCKKISELSEAQFGTFVENCEMKKLELGIVA